MSGNVVQLHAITEPAPALPVRAIRLSFADLGGKHVHYEHAPTLPTGTIAVPVAGTIYAAAVPAILVDRLRYGRPIEYVSPDELRALVLQRTDVRHQQPRRPAQSPRISPAPPTPKDHPMSSTTDALAQQRRVAELTYDQAHNQQVRMIAGASGLPVRRVSGLLAIAVEVGNCSLRSGLQLVEQSVRWAKGSPVEAARALHRDLPVTSARPRQRFGDGSLVKITMETWAASPTMLQGPGRVLPDGRTVSDHDRRERVASWSIDTDARVYWRHQRDRHNPDLGAVGRIVAGEADAVTRDLRVWVELTDPDLVERALFRDLSASPGLAADGPLDRGWSVDQQEHTRTWRRADVVEISLVPFGQQALGGVAVELSTGTPSTVSTPTAPAISDWDEPRSARSDRQVYRTTRTPSGQLMQWRPAPGLHVS